ncbi:MAG: Sedoheptulose 1,7-bisphosphatase [Ramalina farinacea]|uniref:Sedoheptulose 1,7-bisphosphatase n=1 Tax=Ramalina farinacea TaxID=258253 RepID=A0AA43TV21_9LECA|nr:Sedoheptulose 1,7-bisphosphatase [Ramalina farinacea]
MTTPRAFLIRHGETSWSLNGRHTGTTELPLTANGERRIIATGKALVGDDRLIGPGKLGGIYVSPRHRARRTLELLNIGCRERMPWHTADKEGKEGAGEKLDEGVRSEAKVQVTEDIREWDYGVYEGLTSQQVGLSPADVTTRLDRLIHDIRTRFHNPAIGKPKDDEAAQRSDVLLVAHGHILRAFAMRWIGRELSSGVSLLLEAGGVGTLSYEHHRIEEPAILPYLSYYTGAGIVLPQDVASDYWAKVASGTQRSVDGCNGGIQAASEPLLGGRFFSGLYAEHCTTHPRGQYIQLGYHTNEKDSSIVESKFEGDSEDEPGPEEDVRDPDNPWDEAPDTTPTATAVAAVSGPSTIISITATIATDIAGAASVLDLGVGLGTTHTDYVGIPPVTLKSTGSHTGCGSTIPNATFHKLLDQAQDDFNNAKGHSITKSHHNITVDVYSLRYMSAIPWTRMMVCAACCSGFEPMGCLIFSRGVSM